MGVAPAFMQVLDFAFLYNHKATYRKQNLFAPQTAISKVTYYALTHADTLLLNIWENFDFFFQI